MHGIGNDYIYFDCLEEPFENPGEAAAKLSDRHFGIGGDGIVLICPSEIADAKMRMFNADGSEGKMCGNAIRCVGKYLFDFHKTDKTSLKIETLSGIKTLELFVKEGKVRRVRVDMGPPELLAKKIPVTLDGGKEGRIVNRETEIAGDRYAITCVSMGNPHCVVFSDPDEWAAEKIGPLFENAPIFPERTNTEFVKVLGKNEIKMRVWERGSGETWRAERRLRGGGGGGAERFRRQRRRHNGTPARRRSDGALGGGYGVYDGGGGAGIYGRSRALRS